MFGGLIDRCRLLNNFYSDIINSAISIYPDHLPTTREVSSKPYSLSLRFISQSSSQVMQIEIYRGQKFSVPLLAEMQSGNTSTIVTAITSSTARLETYQTSQQLPDYCAPLSYTIYSTESREQVVLYPDGPC